MISVIYVTQNKKSRKTIYVVLNEPKTIKQTMSEPLHFRFLINISAVFISWIKKLILS